MFNILFSARVHIILNSQTLPTIDVDTANVVGGDHSCPNAALEWTKKQCVGKSTCTLHVEPNVICGRDIAPGERKTYSALFSCEGQEGADDIKGTAGIFSVDCLGKYVRIKKIN